MMKKSLLIGAALGVVGWVLYQSYNKQERGISDNLSANSGGDGGLSLDSVSNTIQGGFMKVSGFTGQQINGGMTASYGILNFLKGFEEKRLMPYFATEIERAKGKKTIGYGHLILKFESFDNGITDDEANQLFINDVGIAADAVINAVNVPLSQNQFDALVSFVFNVGVGNFAQSTLLKKLNLLNYDEAANQLMRWVYQGGKVLNGLYKRRAAELQIFKFNNYNISFGG